MSIIIVTRALKKFIFHSDLMEEKLKFYFHDLSGVFMGISCRIIL